MKRLVASSTNIQLCRNYYAFTKTRLRRESLLKRDYAAKTRLRKYALLHAYTAKVYKNAFTPRKCTKTRLRHENTVTNTTYLELDY